MIQLMEFINLHDLISGLTTVLVVCILLRFDESNIVETNALSALEC